MKFFSEEELGGLKEFQDLDEALENSDQVYRFSADRFGDPSRLGRLADLVNLQSLSVTLTEASAVVEILDRLPHLQVVSFQACQLKEFPLKLAKLPHLRSLSLGNNRIEVLPESIGEMTGLREFRMMQNNLSHIPETIGRLELLRVLGFSYNRLVEVPDSLFGLTELEFLFLDSNRLERLPGALGNLRRLESLSLNFNKLTELPESICELVALERLSLEHNPWTSLPSCLGEMTDVKINIEAPKRSLYMDWSYRPSDRPPLVALEDLGLFLAPGSTLERSLHEAVQQAGLGYAFEAIRGGARDAIRFDSTEPEDYSVPGRSRLGGFPDLPEPGLFPKTDGLFWTFLCQINLAEIASLNCYLPRTGLLSFFIDSTESLQAKVVFHQGEFSKLAVVRHGGGKEMVSEDDDYSQKPFRVAFARCYSLPHTPPEAIADDAGQDAYRESEGLAEESDHFINGYTFTQHESPSEQAADRRRGRAEEWVPLLRLGWDSNVGFCFWDAGTLTFCIHLEDLRRADFSNIHLSLESS
jgi:uncharacterized protein YwqG